jgi:uncharacterized protein (TIGR04222 family)
VNPFTLPGLAFLLFYAACLALVLTALWLLRRAIEPSDLEPLTAGEPYQLAYLRDGPAAAVEVALLSLIDRGLLSVGPRTDGKPRTGPMIQTDPRAGDGLRLPFEKQVFAHFATPGASPTASSLVAMARSNYQRRLEQIGLLVSSDARVVRALLALAGAVILWLVAGIKISYAHAHGHHNIGFLIVLACTGTLLCAQSVTGRRTLAGKRCIGGMQDLFCRLRARRLQIQPGGATDELPMLAAVYGLDVVSASVFPHTQLIRRAQSAPGSHSCGSSHGSSCGSSSCGGSSCGGGGGGCGGCGGGS